MKQLTQNCNVTKEDWLEADVIAQRVYITTCRSKNEGPSDVALTPTQARELAEWLEQAAIEAEAYDDEA